MIPSFPSLSSATVETALALMERFYDEESLDYQPARAQRALQDLLAAPFLGGLWLIQIDSEAIGYFVLTVGFSLEFAGPFALLDEFYVQPPYRGHGIGARALEFIELTAASLGVAAIRLEVDRASPRVRAFYGRAGFQPHDRDLMTKRLKKFLTFFHR